MTFRLALVLLALCAAAVPAASAGPGFAYCTKYVQQWCPGAVCIEDGATQSYACVGHPAGAPDVCIEARDPCEWYQLVCVYDATTKVCVYDVS